IDFFARLVPGNDSGMDQDGRLSAQGTAVPELLEEMMAIPFLRHPPPKAAGYDEFGPGVLRAFGDKYKGARPLDLLRTGVEFSALSIARAYTSFVLLHHDLAHITFTGGGCYNRTLMRRIRELLPQIEIRQLDKQAKEVNDAKEALGFAILANETLSGRAGNVPTPTGAGKPVWLGDLAPWGRGTCCRRAASNPGRTALHDRAETDAPAGVPHICFAVRTPQVVTIVPGGPASLPQQASAGRSAGAPTC